MDIKGYLVSIIIPVYKVEKYLKKCLDSILAQTYTNYEVILVDDGSPDRCGEICDEYAHRDARIRVIHQENQGQAAARNNAARIAAGEYITFVDSDDYVKTDYLAYLVSLQKKYKVDMVIARGIYCYEGKAAPSYHDEDADFLLKPQEVLTRLNYNIGMSAAAWAKLFHRRLVLKHPFPEGQIYEDLAVIYKMVCDCSSIAYGRHRIYFWLQREGSTMHASFSEKQMAAFTAVREQMEYVKDRFPSVIPSAKARYETKIVELMPMALKSSNSRSVFRQLQKQMLYYKEVLRDPNVRRSQKFRLSAIRCGYLPTRIVFFIHRITKERMF